MIEAWEARLAGNNEDAEARYEAARNLARVRGFRYLDVDAVAKLPVEDVVERVEAIPAPSDQPDPVEGTALLGAAPELRMTVSKTLELYWTLAREKTFAKSEGQLRRWEAPSRTSSPSSGTRTSPASPATTYWTSANTGSTGSKPVR